MGVDGDGRGLSLQCVLPGLPPRLAANLLHLGPGWGSSPGDQEPSGASICSLSPVERSHTVQACGPELVSLLHRASVSPAAPWGRGVGKQFIIVCWEVPPWPGAESDFWFGVDSGPRGWHSLPSPKHPSTPRGLVCVRLEASPCRIRADVPNGFYFYPSATCLKQPNQEGVIN